MKSLSENGVVMSSTWGGHSAFCFFWKRLLLASASQASGLPPTLLSLTHSPLLQQFLLNILGSSQPSTHLPGGLTPHPSVLRPGSQYLGKQACLG